MTTTTIEPTDRALGTMLAPEMPATATATMLGRVRRCLGVLGTAVEIARVDLHVREGVQAQDLVAVVEGLWGQRVQVGEVFSLGGGGSMEVDPDGSGWLVLGTAMRGRCQRIEPVRVDAGHPLATSDAEVAAVAVAADGRRWLVEAGAGRDEVIRPLGS